ncbi:hypothetical protein [Citrobacter freundii]|uniref:hypothetical protein n=1 Tax=Citrobacter freundii TaxID=546 RepID=UPI0023B1C6CF|nr:hypothetical protein [Citrobacter freundii]
MNALWKPMPYFVLRDLNQLSEMKRNNISQGIAAIKLFIVICLKSENDENSNISAGLTYDEFTKLCSLSRKLVNEGLRYLERIKVIQVVGVRKKRYVLNNCKRIDKENKLTYFDTTNGFWCKLPYRGLVDENGRITAFESMTNRSLIELNSLKLFLYLLMIRSRNELHSSVTLKTLRKRFSMTYQEIATAIGFLQSLGLLEKVSIGANSTISYDDRTAIEFLVCGWRTLEWKPNYMKDEQWVQKEKQVLERFV